MKIIIFGATGTVGQQLINQALGLGHIVTAFTRNAEKLKHIQHQHLKIFCGDVMDLKMVTESVQDQDAILCTLGAGRKGIIRSAGTQNIIRAMEASGLNRLICQTTLGCGESYGNLNFFWKHIMFGWILKQVFIDHELQEQYIKDSHLGWTIIRPGAFTNGALTANYRYGFSADDNALQLKISRADVAHCMLQQLQPGTKLNRAVSISY